MKIKMNYWLLLFFVCTLLPLKAQEAWDSWLEKANAQVERKNFNQALLCAEKAQAMVYELHGKQSREALYVHGSLEFLYDKLGYFNKALALYQLDAEILTTLKKENTNLYTDVLTNTGLLLERYGRYTEAEALYRKSLDLQGAHTPLQEVSYYNTRKYLANIQFYFRQYEVALEQYKQVLDWETSYYGEDHQLRSITLHNIGVVYLHQRQWEPARAYLLQALNLAEQIFTQKSEWYADYANSIGNLYLEKNSLDSAFTWFKKAETIRRQVSDVNHPDYASIIANQAKVYKEQGRWELALQRYQNALEVIARAVGENCPLYIQVLYEYIEVLEKKNSFPETNAAYQQLHSLLMYQVEQVFPGLSESEKSSYWQRFAPYINAYRKFCLVHYAQHPELKEALWKQVLQTKGIIAESMKEMLRPPADSNQQVWHDAWRALRYRYADALRMSQSEREKNAMDLKQLSYEINELEKKMASSVQRPKTDWVPGSEQCKLQLKKGEVAIEWVRIEKSEDEIIYLALVLKPENTGLECVVFPNGKLMETKWLKYYQNCIRFKTQDTLSYASYWKSLQPYMEGCTTLVMAPDGVYNKINALTFWNPENKKYLADQLHLKWVHSLRFLKEPTPVFSMPTNGLLLGAPAFYHPSDSNTLSDRKSDQRALLQGQNISALPGTEKELNSIASVLMQYKVSHVQRLGLQASEKTLKQAASPEVLHLATHGFFNEENTQAKAPLKGISPFATSASNPLFNSGLILALAGSPSRLEGSEDGIITAYEALSLPLEKTKLVVLSACETALGEIKNGEGVYGLQRSMKLAGANYLLMSLWKVNDEATAELMHHFYKYLFAVKDPVMALQMAQAEVRKKYPSPYFWGAFIVL